MAIIEARRQTDSPKPGRLPQMIRGRLMTPVEAAGLAVIRIGFGSIMTWEAWRYIDRGFIRDYFLTTKHTFTWWAFDWVRPHPVLTYVVVAAMAVGGICVALGLFYRAGGAILTLSIAYIFLLDKATYLNHLYLVALIAFLMTIVPAHAIWSLDARRKPWLRSSTIPAWTLWLMRFQVGIPYFFAGVAKLNFDWLVRAEPLSAWLTSKTDFPIIGHFFTNPIATYSMSYASAALDLGLPFLMLNRRLRAPVYGVSLGFHFFNSRLFGIGIFPWTMMFVTTIFFEPDWPRRMIATLRQGERLAKTVVVGGALAGSIIGAALPTDFAVVKMLSGAIAVAVFAFHMLPERFRLPVPAAADAPSSPWRRFAFGRPLAVFLCVWVAIQVLVPLRHFAIPGNVHWTEEGHRFSWHMLLRQKDAFVAVRVYDPDSGESWTEDLSAHLTARQAQWMGTRFDMLVSFAHYLDRYYRSLGLRDVEVRVRSEAWLNVREPQTLVDPEMDLTTVRRPLIWHSEHILPLEPYD